jgi:hypothetical protein
MIMVVIIITWYWRLRMIFSHGDGKVMRGFGRYKEESGKHRRGQHIYEGICLVHGKCNH